MDKNKFEVIQEDNLITINIKKQFTMLEYCKEIEQLEKKLSSNISFIKEIITDGNDFLIAKVKPQNISLFKQDNYDYIISQTKEEIKISQKTIINEDIHETYIEIDIPSRQYKIVKYIHDKNCSTKECRKYPYDENTSPSFCLEKKEALSLAQNLLEILNMDTNNFKIIDIYRLYLLLNLIPNEKYFPIISDDLLTLSSNYCDIYKIRYAKFQIILNETRESVGQISFEYSNNGGFSYGGNVSYDIKPEFQNKHYATKALHLLKIFLTNHKFKGDKDLYIATTIDNAASQKVATNNEGTLIYDGTVPKNEFIRIIDGIKKVKVYQIKI